MTMTKTGKAFLVLAATLLTAGTAAAQTQQAVAPDAVGASGIEAAQVQQRLARADELLAAGQAKEAREVLTALADEQQAAGVSAAASFLKLAAVHQARGNLSAAASTLDQAAEEAEEYGEPALQVRALMDANAVYTRLRVFTKAQARADRVQQILDAASPEQRAEIEARIAG